MKSGEGGGRKVDRRRERRCEPEFWIVEGQHRPIDIDALVRWRRRHVIVDHRERRRRLERSGEIGEPPLRVGGVRPARITPQIAPMGVRRINHAGPAPSDGLASGGDDGAHPRGHGIIRIGREEIEITLQRIAVQRLEISLLRVEIADRPRASVAHKASTMPNRPAPGSNIPAPPTQPGQPPRQFGKPLPGTGGQPLPPAGGAPRIGGPAANQPALTQPGQPPRRFGKPLPGTEGAPLPPAGGAPNAAGPPTNQPSLTQPGRPPRHLGKPLPGTEGQPLPPTGGAPRPEARRPPSRP